MSCRSGLNRIGKVVFVISSLCLHCKHSRVCAKTVFLNEVYFDCFFRFFMFVFAIDFFTKYDEEPLICGISSQTCIES